MADQFIGYYHGPGVNPVPVSTGTTHGAAQAQAVTRVLSVGSTDGAITVRAAEHLDATEFKRLTALLDKEFAKHVAET